MNWSLGAMKRGYFDKKFLWAYKVKNVLLTIRSEYSSNAHLLTEFLIKQSKQNFYKIIFDKEKW